MRRTSSLPVTVVAIGLALGAVVGLSGCGGASSSANPTTTRRQVTTTAAPATTLAPTTTLPSVATVGFPSTYDAANHLVSAWEAHDRAAAAQGADAAAVAGIFATPDPSMGNRGCSTDDTLPEGGCIYATATGLVQINTEKRPIGWVVATATYEPF
jgi:hypothetical protein